MAMSKKNVGFLFFLLVILLGGGVTIFIIFKNKNNADETDAKLTSVSDEVNDDRTPYPSRRAGAVGTRKECQNWLQNSNKPWDYAGQFTKSKIATRESVSARNGDKIIRNSFWIVGDEEKDLQALDGVRLQACLGKIPVLVIKMRPSEGLMLSHEHSSWNFYKPESVLGTWEQYDVLLNKYLKILDSVPTIVILEPDLLMFAYDVKNNQHRWKNKQYEDEFLIRANKIITKLRHSRVYVDAGNAAYLTTSISTLDQMANSLLRLPGLRGFTLNAMHFVNQTYNEFVARHLYCRTGYHYMIDTSRNGGSFSRQPLPKVLKCLSDPPNMKQGQFPGWAWGSQKEVQAPRLKRWISQLGSSAEDYESEAETKNRNIFSPNPSRPKIRTTTRQTPAQMDRNDPNWAVNQYNNLINSRKNNVAGNTNTDNPDNNHPTANNHNNMQINNPFPNYNRKTNQQQNDQNSKSPKRRPYKNPTPRRQGEEKSSYHEQNTNQQPNNVRSGVRTPEVAAEYLQSFKSNLRSCMSRKSNVVAHDANVWIKTPGESDGRMYRYGVFRKCLINHSIPCDDSCQSFVQADIDRDPSCQCAEPLPESNQGPSRKTFSDFPFQ